MMNYICLGCKYFDSAKGFTCGLMSAKEINRINDLQLELDKQTGGNCGIELSCKQLSEE